MLPKNLVASIPYYYDRLVWCVQKNKPIPKSETIFHLCNDPIVYVAFTLHVVFLLLVAYFLQMFERHLKWDWNKTLIAGFTFYTGLPSTYRPTNSAHRIAALSVFFGGMLFAILIVSKTMNLFTTPIFNPQVKTIDQLLESEFSLVGNAFAYQKISQQTQVMTVHNSYYNVNLKDILSLYWIDVFIGNTKKLRNIE